MKYCRPRPTLVENGMIDKPEQIRTDAERLAKTHTNSINISTIYIRNRNSFELQRVVN